MRICTFGLGYVGTVSSACLASLGHTVVGIDRNAIKVDMINEGQSPIIEDKVGDLIDVAVRAKRLRATLDSHAGIRESDLALVCVGTPSRPNGSLDYSQVENVCREIGEALKDRNDQFTVVIRSTVLPGTTKEVVIPTLERCSGKCAGADFGVCFNPEFLREGTAVDDFYEPPKTIIGSSNAGSGEKARSLYEQFKAPIIDTTIEIAELVKYADNSWHALKVGFANEVGRICKAAGIDGHAVMDIFCQDEKLNLSARYLKPGFAFGGSCLPKDLRALNYKARSLDVELQILSSILPSNAHQIDIGFRMITEHGKRKVGVLGLSFKAGTDDLRESPMVEIVERLLGKGYDIRIFDRSVQLARLIGANRDYILNQIPHVSALMVETIEDLVNHAEVLVIGNSDPIHRTMLEHLREGQKVVDLVRVTDGIRNRCNYYGIGW